MVRRALIGLAVTLVVLLPRGASSQAEDTVKLGFCWPPGLQAAVTATATRTQTNAQTRSGTVRYTLDVSEQGEHLRVRLIDPVADLTAAKTPVSPTAQAQIDERLGELLPDYLVTRAGKFAGLVDLPGYQTRLRALIERSLPATVDRAAVQKALDTATSEPVLNARVSQEWQVLVAAWAGATLPIGVEQTREARIGPAGGPGVTVTHTFAATSRVACKRGGEDRQCVQLDLRSVPEAAAMKAQIGTALSAVGRPLPPGATVKSLDIDERVRLISEVDCLVPHQFTRTRTQTLEITNSGKDESLERTDRSEVTYGYK